MTTSSANGNPRGFKTVAFTAKRRQRATSLVEILVVIVIFLIGILAVVQIFPKGFQLLLTTRNNSVATALGRDAVERLKSNPDSIPDQVLPVRYVNNVPVVDGTINPLDLSPLGDSVLQNGTLTSGGATEANDWMLAAGPNVARRIVGEGARVPAAREVGSVATGSATYENYGGLMVLAHGPVDPNTPLVAYGNELSRTIGVPTQTTTDGAPYSVEARNADGSAITASSPTPVFSGQLAGTPASVAPYEFFVENPSYSTAAILVPATRDFARTYRVRMSAYVGNTAAYRRVDYISLSVLVPAVPDSVSRTLGGVLIRIPISQLLLHSGVLGSDSFATVSPESIRVAPQYLQVTNWTTRASLPSSATDYSASDYTPINPFEMKVVDSSIGVLLFSPAASQGTVDRPGGVSEPLVAKVDYDVLDWRIIGEDFRIVTDETVFPPNATPTSTYSLNLQSLKVGASNGADGRQNGGMLDKVNQVKSIPALASYDPSPTPRDNVMVVDLTTGFEVQRYLTNDTVGGRTVADVGIENDPSKILVSVDKSRGSITFRDADASTPSTLNVRLIPPTGTPFLVNAANRTFRVLYRARNEWSVQVLKSASQYTAIESGTPTSGQYFVGDGTGGTFKNRVYFPPADAGNKVTIDRIVYFDVNGNRQILEGQDFIIHPGTSTLSLAYVDLTDVVGTSATAGLPAFNTSIGYPVTGVKGASVAVRVLWNPDSFSLTSDSTANMTRINQWGRGWRKSTTQTYLRAEESR